MYAIVEIAASSRRQITSALPQGRQPNLA